MSNHYNQNRGMTIWLSPTKPKIMKVTVKELIESLQDFDDNDRVEIAVRQVNKYYPIAYVNPECERWTHEGQEVKCFATKRDGKTVRIECCLPHDNDTYMITSTRKR
jgi:hypothetical protein